MTTKEERRLKIKAGVRGKISGTPERPRLTVFRSNKQIYAQVIDDTTGKTLAAASSLKMDVKVSEKRDCCQGWRTDCQSCPGSWCTGCCFRP